MPAKRNDSPVAAPATVMSRLLSRILGVPDTPGVIEDVIQAYVDEGLNRPLVSLLRRFSHRYPWMVDVPKEVMSGKLSPLVEEVAAHPGAALIAKDSTHSAEDAIWLVIADLGEDVNELRKFQHRGLIHTINLGEGDLVQIVAIQLSSCRA